MCGRYTQLYTWAEVYAFLNLINQPQNLRPSYNVCPTDPVDVVLPRTTGRELVKMRWGLVPNWWPKPLKEWKVASFNARSESVDTKPAFRGIFKTKRCLLPMSGYFEWQQLGGKEKPQPWYFTAASGNLLMAAGLWDEWKNPETGENLNSCTMMITEPNSFVAELHDRMPVLLTPDKFDALLQGYDNSLLRPAPEGYLKRKAVTKRVNSSKADKDDATLIEEEKLLL